MLQAMARSGETGLAAGKGFYDWSGCDVEAVRRQASEQLGKLQDFLDSGFAAPAPGTQPRRATRGARNEWRELDPNCARGHPRAESGA
jgi:hypothetical protein